MTARSACEVLKAARAQPVTMHQLVDATGLSKNTIRATLKCMEQYGIVTRTVGEKGPTGPAPLLYSVAPWWPGSGR